MHALIKNNIVIEWPIVNIRQRFPQTSFHEDLSDNSKLPDGIVYVTPGKIPNYNRNTHKVVQASLPVKSKTGIWETAYEIQPLNDQELKDRLAALTREIIDAVQNRLDVMAQSRGYDNILSLCTYATSTIDRFRYEGQCGIDLRDQTWAKLYEILDEVKSGIRPAPDSYASIETELPVPSWSNAL